MLLGPGAVYQSRLGSGVTCLNSVVIKSSGLEKDVPQRESGSEVAAQPARGTQCVMRAMKTRRNKDMASKPSVAEPRVRMGHAAEQPEAEDKERKLHGGNPDSEADNNQPYVGDGVFEDVRTVVGPEG